MTARIAFIGHGRVGAALADRLQRIGHTVTLAVDDAGSEGVEKALARNAGLSVAPTIEAVEGADVVFLATPFQANQDVLTRLAGALDGKILVDCTNPVGPGLTHGLSSKESGSEAAQRLVPGARVVKAFSIYGFENLEDNAYPSRDARPVMLFCGGDAASKALVGELVAQLGWDPLDVGTLDQALHLEHMTLLWVKMVRRGGSSPHLVWAALRR